jgi:preprotein translocase subunit SecD
VRAFLTTCLLLLAVACGDGKRAGGEPFVVLTFEVAPLEGQSEREAVQEAIAGIRSRLDSRGLDRPNVAQAGSSRVQVEFGARGLDDATVERVIELIGRRAELGIHHVVNDDPAMRAMYQAVATEGPTGISAETDAWSAPGGSMAVDYFVSADDRARLQAWVQAKGPRAAELGARRVVYERIEPADPKQRPRWRTYLIEQASVVGGADVAKAAATYDPQTMRPNVEIELTADGRQRFASATEASIGKKLAIVLDGRVISAPVVQSRIPGGRVQITMGAGDPDELEREAHDLVEVLRAGSMPSLTLAERRDVGPAR